MLTMPTMDVLAADGSKYEYEGYVYDSWGASQETPSAFALSRVINSENIPGGSFEGIDDVCTTSDGRIIVADKLGGRVHIFDAEGNCIKSIGVIRASADKIALNEDGSQKKLAAPTGTFFHQKQNELYICDNVNKTVYVLDGDTYYFKKEFAQPENMSGSTEYVPNKVCVDDADRVYIVVTSSNEGIVELNADGSFSRYFGTNEPTINFITYFWKNIASDTQKEIIGKNYAPAFTNVCKDSEGFIYAVTADSSATAKLFRMNSSGENVIRAMGFPLIGDITREFESRFIDCSVTPYGVTAVLDEERGRIFLYDYDGQILNIFGGYGYSKGQFRKPTSLCWMGYDLIVTDTDLKCIYILKPTPFGQAALEASEEYYYGNWEKATEKFLECIKYNANYEVAYIGVGKNYLMQDDYENAMYYFKLGNDKEHYSAAYNGYRGEQIRKYFWVIAVIFVSLIALLIYSEVRYHKKKPAGGDSNE